MAVKSRKKSKKKNRKKTELKPKILIAAITLILIIAVIASSVAIANNHKREPQTVYDFGKETAQGIDVSEHNGDVDWESAAEEFDFAFIRVGYRGYGNGTVYEDKTAKKNMKAAQKAGIPFGVYFYTQAVDAKEAEEEADFVTDMIKHYDLSLLVMIDFEYPADDNGYNTGRLADSSLSAEENTDIVNAFCDRVRKKGYIAGIYASSSVFYYNFNAKNIDRDTVLWAADYNDHVTFDIDYDIWQYSRTGQTDSVSSKYVDLNYWYS